MTRVACQANELSTINPRQLVCNAYPGLQSQDQSASVYRTEARLKWWRWARSSRRTTAVGGRGRVLHQKRLARLTPSSRIRSAGSALSRVTRYSTPGCRPGLLRPQNEFPDRIISGECFPGSEGNVGRDQIGIGQLFLAISEVRAFTCPRQE